MMSVVWCGVVCGAVLTAATLHGATGVVQAPLTPLAVGRAAPGVVS